MDKKGNIRAFRLTHKSGKWEQTGNVNDADASAPEGLMSVAADENNNFYAVWLDLREGRKNNVCVSTLRNKSHWSKNTFAYQSPESHVCECCKPSIAVKQNTVVVMFRNWLKGARDLYLVTSEDAGKTFTEAQKLGNGTWLLKGCPMDGGGLAIHPKNQIHTAWQRDGQVFYAEPGQPEQKIGDGRGVGMNGSLITWQSGSDLMLHTLSGHTSKIAAGTALQVHKLDDGSIFGVWEKDGQIFYQTF
jgi:hypothetical protein